jgi:hypothetical protein
VKPSIPQLKILAHLNRSTQFAGREPNAIALRACFERGWIRHLIPKGSADSVPHMYGVFQLTKKGLNVVFEHRMTPDIYFWYEKQT